MAPQFLENDNFMPGLVQYLHITSIEDLEGTSYILFTRLFDCGKYGHLIDSVFVKKLFDSLSILKRYFRCKQ